MSIKLMSIAWDTKLKGNDKLILLALCDFANDEGICYPSFETIAKKASCGRRTVAYVIKAFEDLGIVTHEKRSRENGSRSSNLYKISVTDLLQIDYIKLQEIKKDQTKVQILHPTKEDNQSAIYDNQSAIYDNQSANFAPLEPSDITVSIEPSVLSAENQFLKTAQYLATMINSFNPALKLNPETFMRDIGDIVRLDGFTHERIRDCITWVFKNKKDTFYKGVILDGKKLRKNLPSIENKMLLEKEELQRQQQTKQSTIDEWSVIYA